MEENIGKAHGEAMVERHARINSRLGKVEDRTDRLGDRIDDNHKELLDRVNINEKELISQAKDNKYLAETLDSLNRTLDKLIEQMDCARMKPLEVYEKVGMVVAAAVIGYLVKMWFI